jgi:antitoxin YefM
MDTYNNTVQVRKKPMAIHTTYSKARQNLAKLLDEVTKNKETVVIKRRRGESVVMMSEADAASLIETAHLLRSPRNAKRLFGALERALRGDGGVRMSAEDIMKLRYEVVGGREKP